jgi:hypothetical protein
MVEYLSLSDLGIDSEGSPPMVSTPVESEQVLSSSMPSLEELESSSPSLEELEKILLGQPSTTAQSDQQYLSLKDMGISPTSSRAVGTDSFGSVLSRTFNESYIGGLNFLGVIGRQIGSQDLVDLSESQIKKTEKDIKALGTPTRDTSFIKGLEDIDKIYEEEGTGAALDRAALLFQDSMAQILGSVAIPFGAAAAAIPLSLMGASTTAVGVSILAPFIVGGSIIGGQVEEEAKSRGATQEDADTAALITAPIGGFLERFGAAKLIKGVMGKIGKNAIIEHEGKKIGKEAAEKALDRALAFGKEVGKVGTQTAVRESGTEALQETLQQAASQIAAGKPVDIDINRTIDAAVLGLLGGQTIGTAGATLGKVSQAQARKELDELEKDLSDLEKQVKDANKELPVLMKTGLGIDLEGSKVINVLNKIPGINTDFKNPDTSTEQLADKGRIRTGPFNIVKRATTRLKELSNRSEEGARVINGLNNYFNDLHASIGEFYGKKENIIDEGLDGKSLRKGKKLPFAANISKVANNKLFDKLNEGKDSDNPIVNRVGDRIKNEIYKPIHKLLADAGIEIGYTEDYITHSYKVRTKKNRKKFQEILQQEGIPLNRATEIVDTIVENKGVFTPNTNVDFFNNVGKTDQQIITDRKKPLELERALPEETVKKLDEAGLLERDVQKLINNYLIQSMTRLKQKQMETNFVPQIKSMIGKGLIDDKELDALKKVSRSIQGNLYPDFKGSFAEGAYKPLITLGYVSTLAFSALLAVAEAAVTLYKVSPKNAIFGLFNAAHVGFRQAIRTTFPKLPKTDLEKSLSSLFQTADTSMQNVLRDIDSRTFSEVTTNKFFRFQWLSQVTQFTRYMAFDATKKQMRQDIQTLQDAKGAKTRETLNARRRLAEQGLIKPEEKLIQDWAAGKLETEPRIVTQAVAKTIDEIIQTPNVVNRPLWMSNPYLAPVAQLKGFMMVFGNTVGAKTFREVFAPLINLALLSPKGRIPVGATTKYALMFTMIMAIMSAMQAVKDEIRYGDEESPYDQLDPKQKMIHVFLGSNIFGWGTLINQILEADKYGSDPAYVVLGPTATMARDAVESIVDVVVPAFSGDDEPNLRRAATFVSKNFVPILGNIPGFREAARDLVQPD